MTEFDINTQVRLDETLLVEDDPIICLRLQRLLARMHSAPVRTTTADSLQAARGILETDDFGLVLVDIGLPDGSGIDIGRALAGRTPVIALTGYGQPEDLRDSAAAGFHGHLVKPADPQVLHEAILQAARAAASR